MLWLEVPLTKGWHCLSYKSALYARLEAVHEDFVLSAHHQWACCSTRPSRPILLSLALFHTWQTPPHFSFIPASHLSPLAYSPSQTLLNLSRARDQDWHNISPFLHIDFWDQRQSRLSQIVYLSD